MADIRVLIVLDGDRFNFGAQQNPSGAEFDDYFGISALTSALAGSQTPTIQVDKAHRRGYTFGPTSGIANDVDTSPNLTYHGDFTFVATGAPNTVTADLSQYDVLWLIGDEGSNGGATGAHDTRLTDPEIIAITQFMNAGGGVFAVGDHDGIGSYMCGHLPRVRTMRRWFYYNEAQNPPAGNPQVFTPNWSVDGDAGSAPKPDRFDSVRPDAADGKYYFFGQSDPTWQNLQTAGGAALETGPIHTVLRDRNGDPIVRWPDHMHEGEATDFASVSVPAFNPNSAPGTPYQLTFHDASNHPVSFDEFPIIGGYQPTPEVVAYGSDLGHASYYHSSNVSSPPYKATNAKRNGVVSLYDGHAVGIGRVACGSTFHHYLDKNLVGDPGTASATPGIGPTQSDIGLPADVLAGTADYFINLATWLARPNRNVHVWALKNSFGADEAATAVNTHTPFTNAFFVVLDNFTPAQVGGSPHVMLSGPFAATGADMQQEALIYPDGGATATPQRILIPFTVRSIPAGAFPSGAAKVLPLEARLTVAGAPLAAEALFELTAGADPYFSNVDPQHPNQFYLSRDLRVFQAGPGAPATPYVGWPGSDSGYDYIKALLLYLNNPIYGFTSGAADPFTQLSQANDLTEASSVTPGARNFAVARVRLRGSSTPATGVKVFFRLWRTTSNDTDYDPFTSYISTLDSGGLPARPLPGAGGLNVPLFASDQNGSQDFNTGVNSLDLSPTGGESWAYFGCFLDVYGNPQVSLVGTHHCLVAQLAYDPAPILGGTGITLSPENSDKLAQRNIQITPSGNPGGADAHLIPQTFELRPSARGPYPASSLAGRPDELWFDWGAIPAGTQVSIYWPQTRAIEVVRLANLLYGAHALEVEDASTVRITVTARTAFVPIPFGADATFAGLLTLQLPAGVRRGQKFRVVIRRVATRISYERITAGAILSKRADRVRARGAAEETRSARAVAATGGDINRNWRYIVGTFEVSIPVDHEERWLHREEITLSIMKWRLEHTAPSDKWYPVLLRYVAYLARRVDAFGGDAGEIPPSPTGATPPPHPCPHPPRPCSEDASFTGKVCEVIYDCFGEIEGFVLESCHESRCFRTYERAIGERALLALERRLTITVRFAHEPPHYVKGLVFVR